MNLPAKTPAASLPLWIGISVLINCVLVIAAGTGLAARANNNAPPEPILVRAMISNGATRATEPHPASSEKTDQAVIPQTSQPSAAVERPESRRNSVRKESVRRTPRTQAPSTSDTRSDPPRKSASVDRSDSSDAKERSVHQTRPRRNEYDVPESAGPVAVKSKRFGQRLGAGVPGAGKPGSGTGADRAAGGGAEVLTAKGKGGSFAVGGIPPTTGSGPGLGGSGSGIGVGGSGDGVGVPGSGEGLGIGGQGGDAPLPKKVARSAAGSTPGVPAQTGGASGGAQPGDGGADPTDTGGEAADSAPATKPEADSPEKTLEHKPEPKPSKTDLSRFQRMVQRKIAAARVYPSSARRTGQSGNARVTFSISPSGHPRGVSVTGSSGHAVLDSAAVRAVHNAAPFVPFPKGLNRSIRVNATVRFTLN